MTGFENFIQQLINGLTLGSVISLIALGYTMVYGIIELINFAHGDLYMLGAFMALTVVNFIGIQSGSPYLSLLLTLVIMFSVTMIFTAVVNFYIEKLAYRPLRNAPNLAPLISAIGMSFILQNIGLFWGGLPLKVMGTNAAAPKSFPDLIPKFNILETLGISTSLQLSTKDLFVIGSAIPLMLGLHFFVKYTKLGKAMRATAQNKMAARLMGINVDKVISITFIIGGALAGAGACITSLYNNTIVFDMGYTAGLKAFTAAVLGGIGNIAGAMLGGILIGILSALSDQYLAGEWTDACVFAILIIILIFKPSGLLGEQIGEKA